MNSSSAIGTDDDKGVVRNSHVHEVIPRNQLLSSNTKVFIETSIPFHAIVTRPWQFEVRNYGTSCLLLRSDKYKRMEMSCSTIWLFFKHLILQDEGSIQSISSGVRCRILELLWQENPDVPSQDLPAQGNKILPEQVTERCSRPLKYDTHGTIGYTSIE